MSFSVSANQVEGNVFDKVWRTVKLYAVDLEVYFTPEEPVCFPLQRLTLILLYLERFE